MVIIREKVRLELLYLFLRKFSELSKSGHLGVLCSSWNLRNEFDSQALAEVMYLS